LAKRCDGAFLASYEIAVEKARTVALFRRPTGALEDSANVSDGESRTALLSAPFVLTVDERRSADICQRDVHWGSGSKRGETR